MTKQNNQAGERTHYRGHEITIEAAGHPQVQNFYINGKPRGYVVFPASAIAAAQKFIDLAENDLVKQHDRAIADLDRAAIDRTEGSH